MITETREPPEGEESENDSSSPFVTPSITGPSSGGNDTTADEADASGMEDDDDLYHCKYCDINFTSSAEFRQHCQSDRHQKTVSSDEGKEWRYRAPPRGLTSDEYSHCPRWVLL